MLRRGARGSRYSLGRVRRHGAGLESVRGLSALPVIVPRVGHLVEAQA